MVAPDHGEPEGGEEGVAGVPGRHDLLGNINNNNNNNSLTL